MKFSEENIQDFLALFEERKSTIRKFKGCIHLELWQDCHEKNTIFTYSIWESEKHLDNYRFSEFFKDTWSKTRQFFCEKPSAWSLKQLL